MDALLLATKLRIPPQPHRAVRRTRLIDALEQDIPHYSSSCSRRRPATARRRCWPSGRTRAASRSPGSRSARRTTTSSASCATCWRPGRSVQPGVGRARWACSLARWRRTPTPSCRRSSTSPRACPTTLVFVLDDYHLIEDAADPPGADLPARPPAAQAPLRAGRPRRAAAAAGALPRAPGAAGASRRGSSVLGRTRRRSS